VVNRNFVIFLACLGAATAAAVIFPAATVQPGPLRDAHEALADSCTACHAPFRGATRERCVTCHEVDRIGISLVDGGVNPMPREAMGEFHGNLGDMACASCHVEHRRAFASQPGIAFDHDLVPASLRDRCAQCHESRRPSDTLHAGVGPSCAECHTVAGWKPSTFDHSASFRFDDHHPARCTDCHAPEASFTSYSCTGCHEHTLSRMVEEHREEGISDITGCVRCHRTGDEDDAIGGEERGERRGRGRGGRGDDERR
jgi:hypothetical protein